MNEHQVVAVIGSLLALLVGLWNAWLVRRRRRYSTIALVVGAAGPIAALVLYLVMTNLTLEPAVSAGLAGGGAAVGVLAGLLPKLTRAEGGAIRLARAAWLPLPAALALAAVQLCAAAETLAGMIIAIAALEAAAGFGVGAALMLMLRRTFVRRPETADTGSGGTASA